MDEDTKMSLIVGFFVVVLLVLGVGGTCAVGPIYHVWEQEQKGKAELARAHWNRQVAVQEAEAKKDAAVKLAEAEVARAQGVAKANSIIGNSLKGNDAYLRYLWIDKLGDNDHSIIYIPTEAGLPLTEAGHRP
jgi:hypothetical protein